MQTLSNYLLNEIEKEKIISKLNGVSVKVLKKDGGKEPENIKGTFFNMVNNGCCYLVLENPKEQIIPFAGLCSGIVSINTVYTGKLLYENSCVEEEYSNLVQKEKELRDKIFSKGKWFPLNMD